MLAFVLAFILITVLVGLVIYARWHYGTLEKLGIPMVGKPFLIFGNTIDAYSKAGGALDIERFNKFGPIYGVYEGRHPQIHICDAELIRLVTTKDSEYFNDKRRLDFRDPLLNEMPDFQAYEKWKVVRNFLTPAFSSAKIKLMMGSMVVTLQRFCDHLKSEVVSSPGQKMEKFNLHGEYFSMITDLISRCCFSIEIENPSDPQNLFVNIVRGLLSPDNVGYPMLEVLTYSFPILQKIAPGMMNAKLSNDFGEIFSEMMAARKKSGENKRDIIDLCLEQMDKLDTPEYKRLNITKRTIICQALVFFFAGQDQMSSIASCMINNMLKNPEVEKKVYQELDQFLKKHNGKIDYENISELQYLFACITETVRLVPFFSRTERVCTKDWENKEFDLKIKEGMTMIIPIWAANRNPKYFPNPEKFDPERFMPKNKDKLHPYALTSFGHGPRNCIGQRFSNETMVLLSAFVLKQFKFHLRSDSEPAYVPAGPFFSPHTPFYFDVTLR
ncbi:cytochrome P450 3A56 [Folsomia candida]|uniref:Cytochrome P450 3A56 n=1 Tax=Folsomia candida TaxID=158441 RepID=A0A226E1A2_FOLCA|nr:cytochrome P450 3A56 [Folsomia candida]OXA51515.1 Cytochrome P450 3A56 [Folsomia candida]